MTFLNTLVMKCKFESKWAILLCALMLCAVRPTAAQSYSDAFYDALNADDLALQRSILSEWQQAVPDDVDLRIARFNYHLNQCLMSGNDRIQADSAIRTIDTAIMHNPDRLDLRFGKIYFLGQIAQWERYADEILNTLNRSESAGHRWQFPNLPDAGRDLMLEGVQDYLATLQQELSENTTPADSHSVLLLRRIAHRAAQVFPGNAAILLYLADSYMMLADHEGALRYLLRAEKVAYNDPAVLSRIVEAYTKTGQRKLAAQYRGRLQAATAD